MRTLDPQAQLAGSVAKFSTAHSAPQRLQVNSTIQDRFFHRGRGSGYSAGGAG